MSGQLHSIADLLLRTEPVGSKYMGLVCGEEKCISYSGCDFQDCCIMFPVFRSLLMNCKNV